MYKYLNTDKYYQKLYSCTHYEKILEKAGYIDENFVIEKKHLDMFLTPINKIKKAKTKCPIVLVSTGAFNPLHQGHINVMDSAWKYLEENGHEVIGGFFSPANDEYVSQKVKENFEIGKRIEENIEILNDTPYSLSLFSSVCLNIEINFTKVMDYIEKYLHKHVNKNIKICYVYGSDNENFGYLFHYNNDLMACCVKRTNFEFQHKFKNVFNVDYCAVGISSTEIRNLRSHINSQFDFTINNKDIIPEFHSNKTSKMYLKDDGFYSLQNIHFENKDTKYIEFKNDLKCLFEKYFNSVIMIKNVPLVLDNKRDIVSLDEINDGNYNLKITRVFELDFYNRKPVTISNRIETDSITQQIQKQSLINKEIVLFDDDTASGYTIKIVKTILEKYNNKVIDYMYNHNIELKTEDICDIRDFLIGSKGSGLTIRFKNRKYKLPYIFPFVNLKLRSSIEYKDIIEFSKSVIDLNIKFYKNESILLKDTNYNLYCFFKNFGIKENILMYDFMIYLKEYYS